MSLLSGCCNCCNPALQFEELSHVEHIWSSRTFFPMRTLLLLLTQVTLLTLLTLTPTSSPTPTRSCLTPLPPPTNSTPPPTPTSLLLTSGPSPYLDSTLCTLPLTLPSSPRPHSASFSLLSFSVECGWDFVFVYETDKSGSRAGLLAALSGPLLPPPSTTSSSPSPPPHPVVPSTPPILVTRAESLSVVFVSDAFVEDAGWNILVQTQPCPYNCSGVGICLPSVLSCACPAGRTGAGCERSVRGHTPRDSAPDPSSLPVVHSRAETGSLGAGVWENINPNGVCVCEASFAPSYLDWIHLVRGGRILSFVRGPPGTDCASESCAGLLPCPMCSPNNTHPSSSGTSSPSSSTPSWVVCDSQGKPCQRVLVQYCSGEVPEASSNLVYLIPFAFLLIGAGWVCCMYPIVSYWRRRSTVHPSGVPVLNPFDPFLRAFPPEFVSYHTIFLDPDAVHPDDDDDDMHSPLSSSFPLLWGTTVETATVLSHPSSSSTAAATTTQLPFLSFALVRKTSDHTPLRHDGSHGVSHDGSHGGDGGGEEG